MALKDQFKTDANAARDGVWFEYTANSDGTIPAFKLARASKHNKKYITAMRKFSDKYQTDEGLPDFSSLDENEADKMLLDVFADTIILDWRNIQPNDDGVVLEFNRANVVALLGDEDWLDLYKDLEAKAKRAGNFRQKSLEAQAKN